jgi:cyclophilin family peptidyl-prolyl cis-trans isomerase
MGLLLAGVGSCQRGNAASESSDQASARTLLFDPDRDEWRSEAPDSFDVQIETNKGDIVLRVLRPWAPIGVDRFYNLVRHGYYDDQRFFRVRADFIVQFGIAGDPSIMRVWRDRTMPDDPVVASNRRGTLAYAMTGPGTRTTQVYINWIDNIRLDEQGFAPFARVINGMDVLDRLNAEYDERAGGGMRGGRQGPLMEGGNAYLDREFPRLDRLNRVVIIRRWGS